MRRWWLGLVRRFHVERERVNNPPLVFMGGGSLNWPPITVDMATTNTPPMLTFDFVNGEVR